MKSLVNMMELLPPSHELVKIRSDGNGSSKSALSAPSMAHTMEDADTPRSMVSNEEPGNSVPSIIHDSVIEGGTEHRVGDASDVDVDGTDDPVLLKESLRQLSMKYNELMKSSQKAKDPEPPAPATKPAGLQRSLSDPLDIPPPGSDNATAKAGEKVNTKTYLQIVVVWTLFALILFVIAEHQLQQKEGAVLYGALLTVGSAFFFVSIPATHFVGEFVYPEYRRIMPFEGGLHFVVFQTLAWSFYGIGIVLVSMSLYYAGAEKGILAASGVIAVLAEAFMISSLMTFRPSETKPGIVKRKRALDLLNQVTMRKRIRRATVPAVLGLSRTGESGANGIAESSDDTASATTDVDSTSSRIHEDFGEEGNHSNRTLSTTSFGEDSYFGDDDASSIVTGGSDDAETAQEKSMSHIPGEHIPFNSNEIDSIGSALKEESVISQFVQMNFVLVLIGAGLAYVSEHTTDTGLRMAAIALSFTCCIVAIILTHGVGGMLKHGHKGWRFSQMFQGGKNFVLVQIVAWCLFGLALVAVGSAMVASVYFGRKFVEGSMTLGGMSFLIAELLLIFSLSIFKSKSDIDNETKLSEAIRQGVAFDKTKDPINYRRLPEFSYLHSMFAIGIVGFFCNTQYISFLSYLGIFMLPFILPKWSVWSRLTFGVLVDLDANPTFMMAEAFAMWYFLFFSIASWVIFFSILRTFNVHGVKQWVALLVAALSTFGTTVYVFSESPGIRMLTLLTVFNVCYIGWTYPRTPETNGYREWKGLRECSWLYKIFEDYFGLELILDPELKKVAHTLGAKDSDDPRLRQVIMGFHPHGIFPTTHIFLSSSNKFRECFPNLHVNPMVATIIHLVPVMRDVGQWAGVVDVSKKTLHNMFRMGRNIQLVIGGQTEMFESKSFENEIAIVRKRRTAIFRESIKFGLPMIPMYSFGETLTMDNIYLPMIQAWFKKFCGIPIPFIPYGRFYLPIARRRPVTVALGAPVFPVRQCDHPTEEEIVEYQTRYFQALENLFETYKNQCGHGDHKIKWKD